MNKWGTIFVKFYIMISQTAFHMVIGYRGASVTELVHKMFYNEAMNVYTQLDCAECQFRDDATEDRL